MDAVYNRFASTNDVLVAFLEHNETFIIGSLGINGLDRLVRVNTNTLGDDFVKVLFKTLYFNSTSVDINIGIIDPVIEHISKYIINVRRPFHPAHSSVRFSTSKNNGIDNIGGHDYIISGIFAEIDCPFVVINTTFAMPWGDECVNELLISENNTDIFAQYLQDLVAKHGRILVNVMGQKSYGIKPLSWDNLVIDDAIRFMVKDDLELFLKNKDWFEERQLPYRRGYLFHGPPGNGKSTMIRAMLTHARIPAYTIKRMFDEDASYYFEDMFETASAHGKAFVILEDLDRVFTTKGVSDKDSDSNRIPFSMLLNCLDGISESDGVIVIATANNPKVLDRAILQRPGRFDRVVPFPNPDDRLIEKYFNKFSLDEHKNGFRSLVLKCHDFSFAQLRETYILGSQIALQSGQEVTPLHLIEACDRVVQYNEKAGISKKAGF